jgi:hypothetical protein
VRISRWPSNRPTSWLVTQTLSIKRVACAINQVSDKIIITQFIIRSCRCLMQPSLISQASVFPRIKACYCLRNLLLSSRRQSLIWFLHAVINTNRNRAHKIILSLIGHSKRVMKGTSNTYSQRKRWPSWTTSTLIWWLCLIRRARKSREWLLLAVRWLPKKEDIHAGEALFKLSFSTIRAVVPKIRKKVSTHRLVYLTKTI